MNGPLVMKFGGASVAVPEQFSQIADLIIRRRREHSQIVVVVSAMRGTTDQLIELAKLVHPNPPQREYDMLISVGERISMSLLAMALCLKNQDAVSFTGSQSGIITCQRHSQAHIIEVCPQRIEKGLKKGQIVIVAGFQGVTQSKEITTLGRGGSDTSAVALGLALKAPKVEFFKDVPGVFNDDPKKDPYAACYTRISYETALSVVENGAKILHPRAIKLAEKNGLLLHVRSFDASFEDHPGTLIFDNHKKRLDVPLYESIED
ncbi:MAG: aspartate kinase [Parachlamydiaceae bacterium]